MNIFEKILSEITASEIALFISVFVLFIILVLFYKSSRIQAKIMKESRCYKELQMSQKENGTYSVTAKVQNRPAFDVTYNFGNKSTKMECACPVGDVESVFTNIPYYDMRPNTPYKDRVKYRDQLSCKCESGISAAANDNNVTYYGEPGIRKFMDDTNNTGFFDNILYGSNYEYDISAYRYSAPAK